MNVVHKHMEAIFVVALAVSGVGKYALDTLPRDTTGGPVPMARNTTAPAAKTAAAPAPAPAAPQRA